jgi:DNA-binding CsgD family transcriptional regulator
VNGIRVIELATRTLDPALHERRQKILALKAKGLTESEIAQTLGISQSTISRDIQHAKNESKRFLDDLAKDLFVFEYQQCLEGMDQTRRELWLLYHDQNSSDKTKATVLSLLIDLYERRFRMLSEGPTVVSVKRLGEKVEKVASSS